VLQIITLTEPTCLRFNKSAGSVTVEIEANKPYVYNTLQSNLILSEPALKSRISSVSLLYPRIKNFHIEAIRPNQNLLLYNGCGGYGDQIMTWPVAKYLANRGARVNVIADPGNTYCWWNFSFISSVCSLPIAYSTLSLFDYIIPFDSVTNLDEHSDQMHPTDAMLNRIGVKPDSLFSYEKRIRPVFTETENALSKKYAKKAVGIYQLGGSSLVRSLTPDNSANLAVKLAKDIDYVHWICAYDKFVNKDYTDKLAIQIDKHKLSNIELLESKNLRELWALVGTAKIVIAPDSMLVHVAGVLDVPCIGLWGMIDSLKRTAYYKNHYAIMDCNGACNRSPCYCCNGLPAYCPGHVIKSCLALNSIMPSDVVSMAKNVLNIHENSVH
jgi:ADP-heptose:LPS heptosyltransferase